MKQPKKPNCFYTGTSSKTKQKKNNPVCSRNRTADVDCKNIRRKEKDVRDYVDVEISCF